ncbi:MAG: glycosyl transferase family 1 [Acidobacteria bacterium]|nr:MAG: glycosyl transferase family 1 [Acidobacteriota bacterium]
MKILVLTKYGDLGPSSRVRFYQYIPFLEKRGAVIDVSPLLDNAYVKALYSGEKFGFTNLLKAYWRRLRVMRTSRQYDLVWIENECLPFFPFLLEKCLYKKHGGTVVNYDDAIFHRYDLHPNAIVKSVLGQKIDRVMSASSAVIAGNRYLANRASRAQARQIEVLPSVIDLDSYPMQETRSKTDGKLIIGWIGTPNTARFLSRIHQPLTEASRSLPVELHLMGLSEYTLEGVQVQCVPWTESGESKFLAHIDVGIMPLDDGPFERGKCGYKLIQYFASSKPVIASPVGVNKQLVSPENGFLAETRDDWLHAFRQIHRLKTEGRLSELGVQGRKMIERHYSIQSTVDKLWKILQNARSQ